MSGICCCPIPTDPRPKPTTARSPAAPGDVLVRPIVGQGGSMEIMDVVANPDSPCIGTVFFHAERYGTDLLSFALPIVRGRSAPVVHYVPHEFMGKGALVRTRREALARPS